MLPRCGRVAHICGANETARKTTIKIKEKIGIEPQLPLKSEGCNAIQGFRGNCGFLGKLGMCPSLPRKPQEGLPKYPQYQNAKYKIETVDKCQKICYTER